MPFWYITSGNHRYQRAFVGIRLAWIAKQQSALLSLSDAIWLPTDRCGRYGYGRLPTSKKYNPEKQLLQLPACFKYPAYFSPISARPELSFGTNCMIARLPFPDLWDLTEYWFVERAGKQWTNWHRLSYLPFSWQSSSWCPSFLAFSVPTFAGYLAAQTMITTWTFLWMCPSWSKPAPQVGTLGAGEKVAQQYAQRRVGRQ